MFPASSGRRETHRFYLSLRCAPDTALVLETPGCASRGNWKPTRGSPVSPAQHPGVPQHGDWEPRGQGPLPFRAVSRRGDILHPVRCPPSQIWFRVPDESRDLFHWAALPLSGRPSFVSFLLLFYFIYLCVCVCVFPGARNYSLVLLAKDDLKVGQGS